MVIVLLLLAGREAGVAVKIGAQMTEAGSITGLAARPSSIIAARSWKGRGGRTEKGAISKARLDRIGLLSPRVNLQEAIEAKEIIESREFVVAVLPSRRPGAVITTSERRCACPLYLLLSPAGYSWVSCYKDCSNL